MRSLILLALFVSCTALVIPPSNLNVIDCVLCERAVKIADPIADKDAEEIKKAVDKDCVKDFKLKLEQLECERFANKKMDPIINDLKNGTKAEEVCVKEHMCSK